MVAGAPVRVPPARSATETLFAALVAGWNRRLGDDVAATPHIHETPRARQSGVRR